MAKNKGKEYLEGWRRERAAFENFRKEQEKRLDEFRKYATQDVVGSLLEVLDNLVLATLHAPKDIADHKWFEGMRHIEKQFEQILGRHGVKEIEAISKKFDPVLHEVIEEVKSLDKKQKSGIITEVIQKGYKLGDTVLRPSKVKVIK